MTTPTTVKPYSPAELARGVKLDRARVRATVNALDGALVLIPLLRRLAGADACTALATSAGDELNRRAALRLERGDRRRRGDDAHP